MNTSARDNEVKAILEWEPFYTRQLKPELSACCHVVTEDCAIFDKVSYQPALNISLI